MKKKDGIAVITLNRPKNMNAINTELIQELDQVFDEIASDDKISAVIIRGSEKVFAAGADIKEIGKINSPL